MLLFYTKHYQSNAFKFKTSCTRVLIVFIILFSVQIKYNLNNPTNVSPVCHVPEHICVSHSLFIDCKPVVCGGALFVQPAVWSPQQHNVTFYDLEQFSHIVQTSRICVTVYLVYRALYPLLCLLFPLQITSNWSYKLLRC